MQQYSELVLSAMINPADIYSVKQTARLVALVPAQIRQQTQTIARFVVENAQA